MNYFNEYYDFIARNKVNHVFYKDKIVLECHHIIPKSIGGLKSDVDNIVWLTHDNHLIAHSLLNLALCQHKMFSELKTLNNAFSVNSIRLINNSGILNTFKLLIGSDCRHKAKNLLVLARGFANKAIHRYHVKYNGDFEDLVYSIASNIMNRLMHEKLYEFKTIELI